MILDVLDNAPRYLTLNKGFAKAFGFLGREDLAELPAGEYRIDGDRSYAIVARDAGRKREGALLEAHEKYIDIQLVLEGTDMMGWRPRASCQKPSGGYDSEKDLRFYSDEPDAWVTVQHGAMAIFFPEDAHMPLISSGAIHKIIVKVAVEQEG
jgi:YhcH/YjgK/YiaL family protein